jgi:HEAT repeat protein
MAPLPPLPPLPHAICYVLREPPQRNGSSPLSPPSTTMSFNTHRQIKRLSQRYKSALIISGLLIFAVPGAVVYGKQFSQFGNVLTSKVLNQQTLPAYQFTPGQRLVYNIDYQNSSKSDLRVLFEDIKTNNSAAPTGVNTFINDFQVSLQGQLILTVLEQKGDKIFVYYSLPNSAVKITSSGQEAVEQAQLIQEDLKQEIFATLNSQGKVISVSFDPNVSDIAQNFARTLLGISQFVTPNSNRNASNWETLEDDPNGKYIARYENSWGKFEKTKLRYLESVSSKKADASEVKTTIKPSGKLTANFNLKNGYLTSLKGKESQQIIISKKNVGQVETDLDMTYISQTMLNAEQLNQLQTARKERHQLTSSIALSATPSEAETEAKIQRQELGDATLETLLADLKTAEASSDENQNHTPLYLKLKALVYLQPESSKTLSELLVTADAQSLTMQILSGALSAVGNSQAQTALANTINARSQDWDALYVLIPSLGAVNNPIQETEDTLNKLAFNSNDERIASTAQLALGTISYNLIQTSPNRANTIVKQFVQKLSKAKTEEQTRQYLLVLGNTGSANAFDTIVSFTKASSAKIRGAATSALRLIDSKQVEDVITKILTEDTDDSVRLEAATTLGYRQINSATFKIQKQVFISEKSVNVRLVLLRNLWQVREQFPEVIKLVKQAAKNDASSDVREAAKIIIETEL